LRRKEKTEDRVEKGIRTKRDGIERRTGGGKNEVVKG
jgi:hypothetical protein